MKTIKNFTLLAAITITLSLEATYPLIPKPPKDQSIVLLHGFMRTDWSMKRIEHFMADHGYRVDNHGYPSRDKPIEAHALDLIEKLNSITQKYPTRPIHFITHSMGALVVRCAINHPTCPDEAKIGKAVLFAPPNQGSAFGRSLNAFDLVRWAAGPYAGQQLLDHQNFESLGEFPPTMKVLIIAGKHDGKVSIEETRLNGPHEHIVIPRGHSLIMYDRPAIRKALDFLQ